MEKYLVVVAGGKGSRLDPNTSKQFLLLDGLPLLMHTIQAFKFIPDLNIIVVLPEHHYTTWKTLCARFQFTTPHQLAPAGPKRFHSVKSGLNQVPDKSLVAIHDGVRPLIAPTVAKRCFELAERKGSAVPVILIRESMRKTEESLNHAVNRDQFRIVQTPQVFHSSLIKKAYRNNFDERFTDDASVFEHIGGQIHLTEGNRDNIKITDKLDLLLAEMLIKMKRV